MREGSKGHFFKHSTFVGSAWSFVFSSSRQRPMTSDFKGFLYQILSITLFSYLNYWERASISLFNAKQGNYWYHFFNVFGMTRSLSGDWTRDLPHSKPIEPFHIHPINAVFFFRDGQPVHWYMYYICFSQRS